MEVMKTYVKQQSLAADLRFIP